MVKQSVLHRARFILRILWLGSPLVVLSAAASPALGQPSAEGDWVAPVNGTGDGYGWPEKITDAALMSTGRVLVWDEANVDEITPRLWYPNDGSFTEVPPDYIIPIPALHCGGWAHLSDGSLLVAGGAPGEVFCSDCPRKEATLFTLGGPDPWQKAAEMEFERWYPTCTTLPDGRILTVAGRGLGGVPAVQPEIYDPSSDEWSTLGLTTPEMTPEYPSMFVMPDGRVFYAGGGHEDNDHKTYVLDVDAPSWAEYPSGSDSILSGELGATVMYEPGKVLKTGGENAGGVPIRTVAKINLNDTTPLWEHVASAPLPIVARKDHHLILLPDGKILLVGGNDGTDFVLSAAMLDPQLDPDDWSWEDMADMVKNRGHHSVALLLPDATVLTAGGIDGESAEIFRPPYFYTGTPTPKIGYAPTAVGYGQEFTVIVGGTGIEAEDIDKVTLVRPASVTHWLDQDQRFLSLDIGPLMSTKSLSVTSPANANLAPPGYYMLFVVSDAGVPSIAAWIRLDPSLT